MMNSIESVFRQINTHEEESYNGGKAAIIAGTASLASAAANPTGEGIPGFGPLKAAFSAALAAGTLAAFFATPVGIAFAVAVGLGAGGSLSGGQNTD